jgi:hypothetical protein
MIRRIVVLITLVFLLTLAPTPALALDAGLNIDYDYCSVQNQPHMIYIECREEYLFGEYGLWFDLFPGVSRVIIHRVLTIGGLRVGIILSNDTETGRFTVRLPPYRDYAGRTVIAWNLTVFYWYVHNGTGYIQEANYILRPETWSQAGWEWTFGELLVIGIRLRPITQDTPSQPSEPPPVPSWNDFWGWINFLMYLLSEVAKAIPTAISVFINAVAYLVQIAPFLLVIIPLHILFSFIEDPAKGIEAINFYISLGRKLIDLLIKIVQTIVSIIDAIIPA